MILLRFLLLIIKKTAFSHIPDDMPKAQMGSEKEAKCLSEQICRLVETTHATLWCCLLPTP